MTNKESHVDRTLVKLEEQLELWNGKLNEFIAKASDAGQQAKVDSRRHLDELKSKLEGARSKLAEAKAAGSETWATLKADLEHTWKDLEGAFKKLVQ